MDDEDKYVRITLRLPKGLHAKLNAAADATSKSLNAEIVGRLTEHFTLAKKLEESIAEAKSWRANLVDYSAKERQKIAEETKQVAGDIEKHSALIRRAEYATLKLSDVSHVLDLLLPITLDLASHLPPKIRDEALYAASIRVAESMIASAPGGTSEAVHQFLNGSLDAVAAARVRRAFEYMDEVVREIKVVPTSVKKR